MIFTAFIVAFILTLYGMPIAKRFAVRMGLVDMPDDTRKLHRGAIPLAGGIIVFFSAICGILAAFLLMAQNIGANPNIFSKFSGDDIWQLSGLLLASFVILLVGLADDRFGLRGRQKLLGQFLAATILILFGFSFEKIEIFGVVRYFDVFSIVIVYAWMLGAINSVNLLDGADGFATTIGIVISCAMCAMAWNLEYYADAAVCAAVAGTLIGFLFFNFPPASVFLGDSGSMLIGFVLAALAIRCSFKQATAYAFFAPVALLAIPFLDTFAAILRRRLTGRSIYQTDRGHLHHALMRRGLSPRALLIWVALLSATTATGGVVSMWTQQSEYAIISIAIVVVFLVAGRIFGFGEFQLVSSRIQSLTRSILLPKRKNLKQTVGTSVQIQGNRDWNTIWRALQEVANSLDLEQLTLDLNLPWLHESFHANLRRRKDKKLTREQTWEAGFPLQVESKVIGRIDVVGSVEHSPVNSTLTYLMEEIDRMMPDLKGLSEVAGSQPRPADPVVQEPIEHSADLSSTT
jgi:UDP-GlcNAc:undecaprenyl-phosphate/decaprenyl-phosphate GlcNAc-1-phosphate transferase